MKQNRLPCLIAPLVPALALLVVSVTAGPGQSYTRAVSDSLLMSLDMNQAIREGWLDPASETVGIRGDIMPLSWDRTCPATDKDGDGIYEAVVPLEFSGDSLVLSFKIKVEAWRTGISGSTFHRDIKTAEENTRFCICMTDGTCLMLPRPEENGGWTSRQRN